MTRGINSDQLELFGDRLRQLDAGLAKKPSGELKDAALIATTAELAREWLKLSQSLRDHAVVPIARLDDFDSAMSDLLKATKLRTRCSSYRAKLKPFLKRFDDEVVIPSIKWEGSPDQVVARQLMTALNTGLTADELPYIEEAAKCAAVKCYRATVVMLWAAAIARFHHAIEIAGFSGFNAALIASRAKTGAPYNKIQNTTINSLAELQRMRDFDVIAVGMELWKYDLQVFQELERLLGIRNDAAHPGMYLPRPLDVQQFAAKLGDCVFARVPA